MTEHTSARSASHPPRHRHDQGFTERARAHVAAFGRRASAPNGGRPAAVAAVLAPDAGGRACFLITRRAANLRSHSRQWALPGGMIDEGESAVAAALRELREELGLVVAEDAVLGLLDDYPTRSGYVITPVVVCVAGPVTLAPSADEVSAVYHVPFDDLDRPDTPRFVSIPESDRPVIQLPLLGALVHAPTAAVIYQLREVVVHGRDTRVDHFEQPVFAWQ